MHLAELNIARLRFPLDDPRVADFADNLDRVNGLAETMPGFVWRMGQDDTEPGTDVGTFGDPMTISNFSVWETPEALERFVWQTVHKRFYNRKAEWFEVIENQYFAMWWVEPGHVPTQAEAEERLAHLRAHGPSDFAFGWESLPQVQLWKEARCA